MAADPKFIGKTYGPFKYEIGLEKIKEYAFAVGETNPHYTDEEFASKTPFGSVVAPPMFAVVYQKSVAENALLDKELSLNLMMLVHGEQEFEFHNLVKPGDVILTEGRISEYYEKDGKDFIAVEALSKRNGQLVTTGRFLFVIRGG
jgi:acyl dehydratase